MEIVDFSPPRARPIERYESVAAASVALGAGRGETRVHCVHFEPGGSIGEHPTGSAQLFLVVSGSGWVRGGDGRRLELGAGQGVWIERGENHSKGSDDGMTAIMVQVDERAPGP